MSDDTNKNSNISYRNQTPRPTSRVTFQESTNTKLPVKETTNTKPPVKEKEVPQPTLIPNKTESSTFFQMDTTISKMVFVLLLLVVFVLLFQLGLFLLEFTFGTTRTPYLIHGKINSHEMKVISSNPNLAGSVPIVRSVNEVNGIEYTWSVWVYIEDPFLNPSNEHKRIFTKGTYNMGDSIHNTSYKITFLNNSPGLYYNDTHNKFVVVFNTYSEDNTIYETIDIEDIPIEKWVSCVITMKDRKVNIYINGVMTKEYILLNVPKQNYYDTMVGDKQGFGGYISNLRYYDYAIPDTRIQAIMSDGPNLSTKETEKVYDTPPWLSMNWYYN